MINRRQLVALLPCLGALPLIGKLKPKAPTFPPYWAEVKRVQLQLRAEFPGFTECIITSIENKRLGVVGGRTYKCSFRNAAMRIADGTHRLSTQVEVLEFWHDELEHAEWLRRNTRHLA